MIASRHANRGIAQILRISMKTVDAYRTHIMKKLMTPMAIEPKSNGPPAPQGLLLTT